MKGNFYWTCLKVNIYAQFQGGNSVNFVCSSLLKSALPYLPYVIGHTGLNKQYRPRWDAAERGISSGSTLFVTYPAMLRHNIE